MIYVLIAAGTLAWALPFPIYRSRQKFSLTLDPRARWGVVLQCIGYTLLWQGSFWTRSPSPWQLAMAGAFFITASLLSWLSSRALGRHLRVDAAVTADHELVRSGPYGLVRHPIYTSMLCVLLATGFALAQTYLFVAAIVVFYVGSEIRMRVEEKLLESSFGAEFDQYRREVPRFLPVKF